MVPLVLVVACVLAFISIFPPSRFNNLLVHGVGVFIIALVGYVGLYYCVARLSERLDFAVPSGVGGLAFLVCGFALLLLPLAFSVLLGRAIRMGIDRMATHLRESHRAREKRDR